MTDPDAVAEWLTDRLNSDTVFWDIGAFHGQYSELAADAGASVVAFEPNDDNAEVLAESVPEADAHRIALADWDGRGRLVRDTTHDSTYRIKDMKRDEERLHVHIPVYLKERMDAADGTLKEQVTEALEIYHGVAAGDTNVRQADTLLADGVTPPDVMKIDVEGAEAAVLRGARALLATYAPAVVIEVHTDTHSGGLSAYGDSAADVRRLLTEAGYTITPREANGRLAHWFCAA